MTPQDDAAAGGDSAARDNATADGGNSATRDGNSATRDGGSVTGGGNSAARDGGSVTGGGNSATREDVATGQTSAGTPTQWGWVVFWALSLLVLQLLVWVSSRTPETVERVYGDGVFRIVATAQGAVSSRIPFSLMQLLLLAGVVALLWALIGGIRKAVRTRRAWLIVSPLHRWLGAAAIVLWVFQFAWGFNYSRPDFAEKMGLEAAKPDPRALASMVRYLAHETNQAYAMALRFGEIEAMAVNDTASASHLVIGRSELAAALDRSFQSVVPSMRSVSLAAPKFPRPVGWLLTRIGISGFYSPFTGEATVNAELPDVSVPFTTAHEMAHQRGTARENEANAIAYLACRDAGMWATRYSGALNAYVRSWRALRRVEPDSAQALGRAVLDQGPLDDLAAVRRFWTRHEGPAAQVAEKMNDSYLKANRQEDGVASYGRMVDILLTLDANGMLRLQGTRDR